MEAQITLVDGCTLMLVSLALNKTWKEGETACLAPSRGEKNNNQKTKFNLFEQFVFVQIE